MMRTVSLRAVIFGWLGFLLLGALLGIAGAGCATPSTYGLGVQRDVSGECKLTLESGIQQVAVAVPGVLCNTPLSDYRLRVFATGAHIDSIRLEERDSTR